MLKARKKQFGGIYDDHIDKIYRFVFLKLDSQEAAQDVTSRVFLKGWKRFKSGSRIENVSAYLYQIARAEIANYYRGEKRYQVISTDALPVADEQHNIERQQMVDSDIAAVKKLLCQLDEDAQNVLIWKYLDNYSNQEIAEMLGKSEGAVRVMLHRALVQLREKSVKQWPESLFGRGTEA